MEYIDLFHQVGITFGVGASTFALIFYILALQDGVIDKSEKHFMHAVYFVLRIGMFLIIATLVLWGIIWFAAGNMEALLDSEYLFKVIAIAVITINAILMTKHVMPMWLGPSLAGGSWYSLMIVHAWPAMVPAFSILLGLYATFLVVFVLMFNWLKKHFSGV